MTELLRTEDLKKSFGHLRAVDGVDIHIDADALTSVIGANDGRERIRINMNVLWPSAGSGRRGHAY